MTIAVLAGLVWLRPGRQQGFPWYGQFFMLVFAYAAEGSNGAGRPLVALMFGLPLPAAEMSGGRPPR